MKYIIGILIIGTSLLIGYIPYFKFKNIYLMNSFLDTLSNEIVANNKQQMLPFFKVFEDKYNEFYSKDLHFSSYSDALKVIKCEFASCVGFEVFLKELEKYINSGAEQIDAVGTSLLNVALQNKTNAEKMFNEKGKIPLLVCPCAALMLMIMLI